VLFFGIGDRLFLACLLAALGFVPMMAAVARKLPLAALLYYYLLLSFYIEYFCNDSNVKAEFDLATGWVEKYGPTMEPDERAGPDG